MVPLRTPWRRRSVHLVILALIAVGCTSARGDVSELVFEDVRSPVAASAAAAAVYLDVFNNSSADQVLTGASTTAARQVQVH